MNTKQLQYAIELAKMRNFSHVSEKLNISQPTLSKQIISLENALGVKLFERSTASVALTPAGEYFVQEAQKLIFREDQLLRTLEQYKSGERGRLIIGVSPFRNLYLMPRVLAQFKKEYPGIQVVLHETSSDQLRKEAAEGCYDFAIVNLPIDDTVLDVTYLEEETLVLAIPNTMVNLLPVADTEKGIDFADCRDLPFVVLSQGQEMRRYFDSLCASYSITPNISIEVSGGITAGWSMARSGLGATLLPLQFVGETAFEDNLTIFKLNNMQFTRQTAIVSRKDQYLSKYAQYAMQLLQDLSSKQV